MPPAPRHNHRWQRTLAWICLLLAAATAVPIGVSFVVVGDGVVLAPRLGVRDHGPTLGLIDGVLTRAILEAAPVRVFSITRWDNLPRAAARKFGPASVWRIRWDASDSDLWFAVPVWWAPLVLSAAGLWLKCRAGGLFSRRLRAQNTIVAASFLFAVNAAAAATRFPYVQSGWPVPPLDLEIRVSTDMTYVVTDSFAADSRGSEQFSNWGLYWARARPATAVRPWAFGIATWWFNVAFGTALLWIGIRAYRRGRDPNACSACGYSLAGLTTPTCPECGKAPA